MFEVKDLSYYYRNYKALNGVNFQAPEKGVVALLGNNGSGKTTLIEIITGNKYPDRGEVQWEGKDFLEEQLTDLEFGYLPEEYNPPRHYSPERYFKHLTSLLQVPYSSLLPLYDCFNLDPVKKKPIKKLSKGYRQRIGIMQAFLGDKRIVILDEPTNGLDPSQRERFFHFLDRVRDDCLVIISSHSLEESLQSADYFLIISNGQITFSGQKESLYSRVREYVVEVSGEMERIDQLTCEVVSHKKISSGYCTLRLRTPQPVADVVKEFESIGLTVEKIDSGLTSLQNKMKKNDDEKNTDSLT